MAKPSIKGWIVGPYIDEANLCLLPAYVVQVKQGLGPDKLLDPAQLLPATYQGTQRGVSCPTDPDYPVVLRLL